MRLKTCQSMLCTLLLVPVIAMAQDSKIEASASTAPGPAAVAEASVAATAPAPAVSNNALIGAAPADKGQIVFFRESRMMGAAIGFKVREGDTELGKLRSGKYFVVAVEPGAHEYNVHGETKDVLNMEVEAGETYYVQGTLGMGIIAGRPNLKPSDEATFAGMSKKLKLAK